MMTAAAAAAATVAAAVTAAEAAVFMTSCRLIISCNITGEADIGGK